MDPKQKKYRVAVLSDSHGDIPEEAYQIISSCDCIIFAGDFCSKTIARSLEAGGTTYMVRGNNDFFIPYGELETLTFRIGELNFFLAHNRNMVYPDQIPEDTDIAVFGHTHQYDLHREGHRMVLNPGSVSHPRMTREKTMAIITMSGSEFQIEKVIL